MIFNFIITNYSIYQPPLKASINIISDDFGGFKFKDISQENFWRVIGRGDDKDVLE